MISRLAPAKINLALHVTGQRSDGYHLIDSLVVFTEVGDNVSVYDPHHPHGPIEIMIDGPFADSLGAGPDNLVSAAAMLLRQLLLQEGIETTPTEIRLEKNLPIGSGIGGGSADAAATLLALSEHWDTRTDVMPLAGVLGADVPMCLLSKPLRAQGIGDEITPLVLDHPLHVLLVNPGVSVSTPEIFAALSNRNNPQIGFEGSLFPELEEIREMRNDLQPAAIARYPVISHVLASLDGTGADLARMSGSGATCFGIYKDSEAAHSALEQIRSDHPDWWCVATKTITS